MPATPPADASLASEPQPDAGLTTTPPLLRILTPGATDEEVAALVAVVSMAGSGGDEESRPSSEWSAHHRKLRRPLRPGPAGWRSSGLS